ncbi:MAG: hypothetical protein IAE92_00025 [Burkholderiaceae bacterium]|nr:hypothetical protein [Burkholderiaceae bacterium]
MKQILVPLTRAIFRGLFIIVPAYLALLLLLKGMKSVGNLVSPLTRLLPAWLPADEVLSLLLFLAICALIGAVVSTRVGHDGQSWIEKTIFEKIPGYGLLRGLTHQAAGKSLENTWKPALFQSDEALIPAFIIEELDDGRFTVFVPSIPTPFAGAVFVLERNRVFPVDVPFTDAVKVVSRWGSGAKHMVAAMRSCDKPAGPSSAA